MLIFNQDIYPNKKKLSLQAVNYLMKPMDLSEINNFRDDIKIDEDRKMAENEDSD